MAILTSGTLSDPDMLRAQPEAAYVLSLWERPAPPVAPGGPPRTLLGACYTDCASNTLTLGQWCVPHLPGMDIRSPQDLLMCFSEPYFETRSYTQILDRVFNCGSYHDQTTKLQSHPSSWLL